MYADPIENWWPWHRLVEKLRIEDTIHLGASILEQTEGNKLHHVYTSPLPIPGFRLGVVSLQNEWVYKLSSIQGARLHKNKSMHSGVYEMTIQNFVLLNKKCAQNPLMLQKACYMFRPCHCIRLTYILSVKMLWSETLWNDMIYHTICLSWTLYKMCNPPKFRALVYAREVFDICWSSCFQWPLSVFWLTLLRSLSVPSNPNRDTQLNPNSCKRKRISLPDMRDTACVCANLPSTTYIPSVPQCPTNALLIRQRSDINHSFVQLLPKTR